MLEAGGAWAVAAGSAAVVIIQTCISWAAPGTASVVGTAGITRIVIKVFMCERSRVPLVKELAERVGSKS